LPHREQPPRAASPQPAAPVNPTNISPLPQQPRRAPREAAPRALQLRGELAPLASPAELELDWVRLQQHCDCSFFLSWSWIAAWLEILPPHAELYSYRCFDGEQLVALCVVGRGRIRRRGLFHSRVLTINEVRLPGFDMTIEYNDLLVARGYEAAASAHFLRDMEQLAPTWDELLLGAIPQARWRQFAAADSALRAIIDEQRTPWVAHLPTLHPDDTPLFSSPLFKRMSSNRRWQIKRSFKEYEKFGPLSLQAAANEAEALAFFDAMGALHTRRWNRVGRSGVFVNPHWVRFHRTLISRAFSRGEMQMLRVSCGEAAIGYIYNFLWRGRVYMLQTGLALQKSNALRPGYVSHCLAINYNAQRGLRYYDFMCGDADYKQVLGQASRPLLWVRLQRPRWKFTVENTLVAIYRRLKALRAALLGQQPRGEESRA